MKLAILAAFSVAIASGASISGTIVDDATGAPVAKSEVRIFGPMLSLLLIEAGDDGTFQTGDLPRGDYTMTAWHPGYLFTEVTSGHPPVIRLVRLRAIEGQLTGLAGRHAKVLAMVKSGDTWKPVLDIWGRGVPADSEGRFRISDLPPGQYELLVAYGNSGVLRFPEGVPLPMPPNGNRLIEGRIELPDPQNQYSVTLSDPVHPELAVATAVADETGSFSFPGVAPGAYELLAISRSQGRLPGESIARVRVDVSQGDARGINIAMQAGNRLGFSVSCGTVTVTPTPREDWGLSLEAGQFVTGIVAPACLVAGNSVIELTRQQSAEPGSAVMSIPDDFTMGGPFLRTEWFSAGVPGLRFLKGRLLGWDSATPWPPHVRMAVPPDR